MIIKKWLRKGKGKIEDGALCSSRSSEDPPVQQYHLYFGNLQTFVRSGPLLLLPCNASTQQCFLLYNVSLPYDQHQCYLILTKVSLQYFLSQLALPYSC